MFLLRKLQKINKNLIQIDIKVCQQSLFSLGCKPLFIKLSFTLSYKSKPRSARQKKNVTTSQG